MPVTRPIDFEESYAGRRVAVTGHTGFTGGWLVLWLKALGADVRGFSLPPPTEPNLYGAVGLSADLEEQRGDIRNAAAMTDFMAAARPEIIFHLAAQPLVSVGYDDPRLTFETNVMGTLNVLEAARNCASIKAVVCVTTDKVYHNREWHWGYRETDALGGKDPYSASKSACEMVINTYQHALAPRTNGMLIASARGGNIIGGGDWAANRIVPDFVRAASRGEALSLRNPAATRPWQHVLALAHGYLMLGHRLYLGDRGVADSWNFGPNGDGERDVATVVSLLAKEWPGVDVRQANSQFVESHFLHLNSEKAHKILGWRPALAFDESVEWAAQWYRAYYQSEERARDVTLDQLERYRARLGAQP